MAYTHTYKYVSTYIHMYSYVHARVTDVVFDSQFDYDLVCCDAYT